MRPKPMHLPPHSRRPALRRWAVGLAAVGLLAAAQPAQAAYTITVTLRDAGTLMELTNAAWMKSPQLTWWASSYLYDYADGGLDHTFSIFYKDTPGYYTPTNYPAYFLNGNRLLTIDYNAWNSTLNVDVTPNTASWQVTAYPSYGAGATFLTAYGTNFTGDKSFAFCPTGSYTMAFLPLYGYEGPAPIVQNVANLSTVYNVAGVYTQWPSTFAVDVSVATNAGWTLSPPPAFTNFTGGFGDMPATRCPTGAYSIIFSNIVGYTTPSPISTLVDGAGVSNIVFNGVYGRTTNCTIQIVVSPTNAPWAFTTNVPSDYATYASVASGSATLMSGTGLATIINAPEGTYALRFNALPGYYTPPAQTQSVVSGTTTFTGTYSNGPRLTVTVYQPGQPVDGNYLAGIGAGSYTISGATGSFNGLNWYFSPNAEVTLTAVASNLVVGTNSYSSFFYKWDGDYGDQEPTSPTITVTMDQDRALQLLFSREFETYDNVGDLDYDRLPDGWEDFWGLDPESDSSNNGQSGNGDNEYIPSSVTAPPVVVTIDSANQTVFYQGSGGASCGYPLDRARMTNGYNFTGSSAARFVNELECRGIDGFYLTNVPPGFAVVDDDPKTDPIKSDTDNDGMTDGWEYYFWYWRSAGAYTAGLTNSANLSWVRISPSAARQTGGSQGDVDSDNDGAFDGEEFTAGSDPTHADTDGDGLDDLWETQYNVVSTNGTRAGNPISYTNGVGNPDGDYFAVATFTVLANGSSGTRLGYNVRYAGSSQWIDYDNDGRFTLFTDQILTTGSPITNRQTTATFYSSNIVYFGNASNMGTYKPGYPVWVDVNTNGTFETGLATNNDIALVNPLGKNQDLYTMAPASPLPGVASFDPRTAWSVVGQTEPTHPNTAAFTTREEYLGADYIGRVSWDPAGRVTAVNDDILNPTRNSAANPATADGDSDLMADGWELYVGLNPQSGADAYEDQDGDKLLNYQEYGFVNSPLNTPSNAVVWPTDPGVLTAPSPNDPHPMDTDWDGATDMAEFSAGSNPTTYDTDGDNLPDGWEMYAGSDPNVGDSSGDQDNDGLINILEMSTGLIDEWQGFDPTWTVNGAQVDFDSRLCMSWDPIFATFFTFMTPDYQTDPSFLYYNGIETDVDLLRSAMPAASAQANYHTTMASSPDSDQDGMDDYWEFYHGLNPCVGGITLLEPICPGCRVPWYASVAGTDADPWTPGFQVGKNNNPFNDVYSFLSEVLGGYYAWDWAELYGPHHFGLELMDPDGDGLPNIDEYSYRTAFMIVTNVSSTNASTTTNISVFVEGESPLYHTDPSPYWMTDVMASNRLDEQYYNPIYDLFVLPDSELSSLFDQTDGFDTDNDGISDYEEVNNTSGYRGNDPLDSRNPGRNRAIYLNGTNDFVRSIYAWYYTEPASTFTVEAWVRPSNPTSRADQVILEKGEFYDNPYDLGQIIRVNYRMGVTNGLPYIMYNGKGAMTVYQATAQIAHRLQTNQWTHVAGVYDGSNLAVYVNGEKSASVYTTEIPASGDEENNPQPQTLIVGARDMKAGDIIPFSVVEPTNFFGGYIDELRIWRSAQPIGSIQANLKRRFSWSDLDQLNTLEGYYTFDDVPDPTKEGIVPNGFTNLDTTSSFHPTIGWWRDYTLHSTVYTGTAAAAYNYIVSAENHVRHRARVPPRDDALHIDTNAFSTNVSVTNLSAFLPPGYLNPTDPYTIAWDLYLFNGAKAVATTSWLTGLTDDPDSTDTDGDGLPDNWELSHGLDYESAAGDSGAWGDFDGDGLNNYAEYLAGTDPRSGDSDLDGIGDYDDQKSAASRTWGELYDDGDGMPDSWEIANGLDPYTYDAQLDPDADGWSNYAECQAATDPNAASSHPNPTISGKVHYYGTNKNAGATFIIRGFTNEYVMDDTDPVQVRSDSEGNFSIDGLNEGIITFFAALDLNGDGSWSAQTWSDSSGLEIRSQHEPAGIGEDNPYTLSWANITNVEIGVEDSLPGYARLAIGAENLPEYADYHVRINRISESGAPQVVDTIKHRNSFGEWDFQALGIYGLPAGGYQFFVDTNEVGVFSITWPSSVSTPTLVWPRGDTLYEARNQMVWNMDRSSTRYRLQVYKSGNNTAVYDGYRTAYYRYEDGTFRAWMPAYAAEWGDGTYYWRIASSNPTGESAWSAAQAFTISLSSTNSRTISGDLYYFGKAKATNITVEAFDNEGFGGAPLARQKIAMTSTTNSYKSAFALKGLAARPYYVRAYLDISPADGSGRNGKIDTWESVGFVRDSTNTYKPRLIDLTDTHVVSGYQIVIRDHDADNDELPDAWEMSYFGNLDQTGDMDYDGDSESNLSEYMLEKLDTDPTLWDSDADGLSDRYEAWYNGATEYDPYDAVGNPSGRSLNPLLWDTDGDGYSDGAEVRRYHTGPTDPSGYPYYRPYCYGPNASPADYDADGRTDAALYDQASGAWYVYTWAGQFWNIPFGTAATQPLLGDYDGDGYTDFAVYYPAGGTWYLYTWNGRQFSLPFGDAETTPIPADYDGDFRTDFGLYYPAVGMWYLYTWQGQFTSFQFGSAAMTPVLGDYDGDARTDAALFEPETGTWYINTWRGAVYTFQFGNSAMTPVPGDYDGDGRTDFALFEADAGTWYIYTWQGHFVSGQFGWSGVIPVQGDYDGDGRTDVAIYYPATGYWYIYTWTGQFHQGQFGSLSTTPILPGR